MQLVYLLHPSLYSLSKHMKTTYSISSELNIKTTIKENKSK